MTRPKVPDDKRQRTANACDSCKRRKQKCDGCQPCATCVKRNLTCVYTPAQAADRGRSDSEDSPKKRKHEALSPPPAPAGAPELALPAATVAGAPPSQPESPSRKEPAKRRRVQKSESEKGKARQALPGQARSPKRQRQRGSRSVEGDAFSKESSGSGRDEDEAAYHTDPRMLQDTRGRLLYIGDAATLSYLQLMRMVVDTVSGQSDFTDDPNRHRIVENTINLPPHVSPANTMLPDRTTAEVLVESYFTNTSGMIEVFDRRVFEAQFDACYSDPLAVDPMFPCLLYNTFAIGLVLAKPVPGSREGAVVERLRSVNYDYAELFYQTARLKGDPCYPLEDAGFWSVQALILMTMYSLAVVKRNNAYNLLGMATRSAYALGLHRQEDNIMQLFSKDDQALRRLVWRSLFILDRFISSSLGRPLSIYDGDCSPEALRVESAGAENEEGLKVAESPSPGLNASFRSCQAIGLTLRTLYSKRKMMSNTAREIAQYYREWSQALHPGLLWRRALEPSLPTAQILAILHVNLLACHSVILLTRPLFLCHLFNVLDKQLGRPPRAQRLSDRMFAFSETCVAAAYHSIHLTQIAFESKALSSHDPFVIYYLFLSTLIVLSNEFVPLYSNEAYFTIVKSALAIMRHCAEDGDVQAKRLLFILEAYTKVVATRKEKDHPSHPLNLPEIPPPSSPDYDPLAHLFAFLEARDTAAAPRPPISLQSPIEARSSIPPGLQSRPPEAASRRESLTSPPSHSPPLHRRASVQSATAFLPPGSILGGHSLNGASPSRSAVPAAVPTPLHLPAPAPGLEPAVSRGPDSVGTDAEFDFDTLWQWPIHGPNHHHADLAPAGIAPGPIAPAPAVAAPGVHSASPHSAGPVLGYSPVYHGLPMPPAPTASHGPPVHEHEPEHGMPLGPVHHSPSRGGHGPFYPSTGPYP